MIQAPLHVTYRQLHCEYKASRSANLFLAPVKDPCRGDAAEENSGQRQNSVGRGRRSGEKMSDMWWLRTHFFLSTDGKSQVRGILGRQGPAEKGVFRRCDSTWLLLMGALFLGLRETRHLIFRSVPQLTLSHRRRRSRSVRSCFGSRLVLEEWKPFATWWTLLLSKATANIVIRYELI